MLEKIFGTNYKTTMKGWGSIIAGVAGLVHCFTGAHHETNVTGSAPPDMVGCLAASGGLIVVGWGLINAKDKEVAGTGDGAVRMDK